MLGQVVREDPMDEEYPESGNRKSEHCGALAASLTGHRVSARGSAIRLCRQGAILPGEIGLAPRHVDGGSGRGRAEFLLGRRGALPQFDGDRWLNGALGPSPFQVNCAFVTPGYDLVYEYIRRFAARRVSISPSRG